ncbi:MAG: FkbM family methyltransferase [Notoacmeibacter sp.]
MSAAFKYFKNRFDNARLAFYHFRHGPELRYHNIPVTVPDGLKFSFKRLIFQGKYEEPERRLIDRFLDPSVPVLELGGSLGIVSAYVGSLISPSTPYRIIEANPSVVTTCQLNANAARTGIKAEVVNAAIAYGVESIAFDANPNVHISRVVDSQNAHTTTIINVRATTLGAEAKTLASDGAFTAIIDVEGMELDIFEHDVAALQNCKLAIVEFHPEIAAQRGLSPDYFFDLVAKAGFKTAAADGNSYAFVRA